MLALSSGCNASSASRILSVGLRNDMTFQKSLITLRRYPVSILMTGICISVFVVAVAQRPAAFLDGYSPFTGQLDFNIFPVIYGGQWWLWGSHIHRRAGYSE
jgi:hypothetical protein